MKSDFQECYEDVCGMINFNKKDQTSSEDKPDTFIAAALEYLNGKRAVRTWRTLWMVQKPATTEDKIILVRLLRRLHNYTLDSEDAGYEHMREPLKILIGIIPDELKFPGTRSR